MTEEEHKARRRAIQHKYYLKNKDKIAAYLKEHKQKPEVKERANEMQRKRRHANPEKTRFESTFYRRNSKSCFTDDWEHVEGYERLIAEGKTIYTMGLQWQVHHRFEDMGLSRADLKEMNLYYHRPACELIIMTASEHRSHHIKLRNLFNRS